MTPLTQTAVSFVVVVVLAVAGFYLGRHWQAAGETYERAAGPANCDLRVGACRADLPDASVTFAISPPELPLMKTLTLEVVLQPPGAREVFVDIRGLNMDMGVNRTRLAQVENGVWQGETILPVCSQRRMEWEAAVQIDGPDRVEIPFLFFTNRP